MRHAAAAIVLSHLASAPPEPRRTRPARPSAPAGATPQPARTSLVRRLTASALWKTTHAGG